MAKDIKFKLTAESMINVFGVNVPVNKRQNLARMLHHLKTAERVDPTSSELLELAIGVTIN